MLDDIWTQGIAYHIGIPHGPSQQILRPIRGGIAIDVSDLPAVFALHGAEQSAKIGPDPPSQVPSREVRPKTAFHLSQPQAPPTDVLQCQFGWYGTRFQDSILQKGGRTRIPWDLQL